MASIRKRTDSSGTIRYHVQVRLQGFPPQTKTFDKLKEAKAWGERTEAELLDGRLMPHVIAQRHTVEEMLVDYRSRVLIPHKPKELRTQGPQLDWWISKIGRYSLADITPAIIGKFRDELLATPVGTKKAKPRAPATVVRYMALLTHAFNVASKEWGWLPASPMEKVKKPKVANGRIRYLSVEELERLRAAIAQSENKFLSVVVEVALATGMRHSEIMNLRWRDLLLDMQGLPSLVILNETKNGERRGVPLTGQGLARVESLRQEHMQANKGIVITEHLLFPSDTKKDTPVELRTAWHTAMRRAKIENFRFHDLRHCTASMLAMEGASGPEIAEILGHKDLQMVKRYAHLSKAHIAGVLTRMNEARLTVSTPASESKSTSV